MPDIAAVIVTYKTPDMVCDLLQSIDAESQRYELDIKTVVVDNASGDDTVSRIQTGFPHVDVIASSVNAGPAVGFNQGLRRVMGTAPYILVANSDTKVVPGSLYRMFRFLEENPGYMGVTGRLQHADGSPQMQRTHVMRILPERQSGPVRTIDFVGTTFALIRAEAYEKVGGYDENYYFYNEDVDWATRTSRAGMKMAFLADVPVIHHLSQGSKQNKTKIRTHLYASNIYYFRRFFPALVRLVFWVHRYEISAARRKLARATDLSAAEIAAGQAVYDEALELLVEEMRTKRKPRIPTFQHGGSA